MCFSIRGAVFDFNRGDIHNELWLVGRGRFLPFDVSGIIDVPRPNKDAIVI
jgi:hypothetical protein